MRNSLDLSLYLVTKNLPNDFESFRHILLQAIEGGVKIVQLRDKRASKREFAKMGEKLIALLRPLNIPLIINDHVDVAQAINADGVHLGQSDVKVKEARALLGPQTIVGLSVESLQQAVEAEEWDIDYLAASPVFSTNTKTDCNSPWGLDRLSELCMLSSHPVIAIGGINSETLQDVLHCGVNGVAVVSAIFDAPSPKAAAEKLSKDFQHKVIR